jgi:hypothetical protein
MAQKITKAVMACITSGIIAGNPEAKEG